MHWGQILVREIKPRGDLRDQPLLREGRISMDHEKHGVGATIIDLGLSRLDHGGGKSPYWTAFDEELFEGQGDLQFEIYRMMKGVMKDWMSYTPLTNVMVSQMRYLIKASPD